MTSNFANFTPKKKMILWKYGDPESEEKTIVIYNNNNQTKDSTNFVIEGNIVTISGVGATIWEMCTGSNSVEQMIQMIVQDYEADPEQVSRDVEAFLTDLDTRGLIILDWSPL